MKRFIQTNIIEILIGIFALSLGAYASVWVLDQGLMRVLVDQNSHLNLTRQAVDSMTPGISQIGFWPPLLHVIMVPFIIFDPLYRSGLSGAFTLIPLLAIASILIYKLVNLFTDNKPLSFIASLIFMINPYVLYYSVTPMMEVLFIVNILAIAYFLAKWIKYDRLIYLLLTGIFVALATVSRFEGLILLPLTFPIVLLRLIVKRTRYEKLESTLILYGLIAVTGFFSILLYGYVYGNNPFAFLKSDWASANIVGSLFHPTKHNLLLTLKYFYHSLSYMLSPFIVLAPLLLLPVALLNRHKFALVASMMVLISPFVFDFTAVFNGNAVIYTPNLPPYERVLNARYGMYNIGFFIVLLFVILGLIFKTTNNRNTIIKFFGLLVVVILTLSTIFSSASFTYNTALKDKFNLVTMEAYDYPSKEQKQVAQVLNSNYDYGKILITRGLNDFVVIDSGIPLKNFIIESNYKYYNQAVERPWLFARWIVTFNPEVGKDNNWTYRTEQISKKWSNSELFNKNYTLVYENRRQQLYKINEENLKYYANDRGWDYEKIPSVNNIQKWNPDSIYDDLKATFKPSLKLTIQSQLFDYYQYKLLPQYKKGYYIDSSGNGTSESQSYAMLQSLYTNDRETFSTVWNWTKKNIQNDDGLFSWKFAVSPENNRLRIIDENSATDADIDIAHALLLAYEKWKVDSYKTDAIKVIKALKKHEIVEHNDLIILTAGNWANTSRNIIINPSYISPAAFSIFAKYDDRAYWFKVKSDSYEVISNSSEYFKEEHNMYLPPNWVVLNKNTMEYRSYTDKDDADAFSNDAFRTIPRVFMDYKVNNDQKAIAYLNKITVFNESFAQGNILCTEFGTVTNKCSVSIAGLSAPLLVFSINAPAFEEKLLKEYYLTDNKLKNFDRISFYNLSWYWFGLYYWSNLDGR